MVRLFIMYIRKAVNTLTIYERLDDATRKALGAKEPVHRPKRDNTNYSEREWCELMNMNRDIYTRKNGRVKRR